MGRTGRSIATFFLLLLSSPHLLGCQNGLLHLEVNPISSGRTDVFAGRGKDTEVRFVNETGTSDVKVFPEPPLTVLKTATGARCTIDGGVWVRDSVFICQNEKVLMVQEFSGSSDFLNFYDTTTCTKLRSLDISGRKWEVTKGNLSVKGRKGISTAALCEPAGKDK